MINIFRNDEKQQKHSYYMEGKELNGDYLDLIEYKGIYKRIEVRYGGLGDVLGGNIGEKRGKEKGKHGELKKFKKRGQCSSFV